MITYKRPKHAGVSNSFATRAGLFKPEEAAGQNKQCVLDKYLYYIFQIKDIKAYLKEDITYCIYSLLRYRQNEINVFYVIPHCVVLHKIH